MCFTISLHLYLFILQDFFQECCHQLLKIKLFKLLLKFSYFIFHTIWCQTFQIKSLMLIYSILRMLSFKLLLLIHFQNQLLSLYQKCFDFLISQHNLELLQLLSSGHSNFKICDHRFLADSKRFFWKTTVLNQLPICLIPWAFLKFLHSNFYAVN